MFLNRLRQHPVFFAVLAVLGAVSLGEVWCLFQRVHAAHQADRQLASKHQEWNRISRIRWAATSANAGSIEDELAQLEAIRARAWETLAGRGMLRPGATSAGPSDAFFELASFVEQTREQAGRCGIELKPDERFGFAEYAHAGPGEASIAAVLRERLIAGYLLEALFHARPLTFVGLARDRRNRPGLPGRNRMPDGDYFEMQPKLSLQVEGVIEATAFQVTFVGTTGTLRTFLNRLVTAELPLIVRAVEVQPVRGEHQDVSGAGEAQKSAVPLVRSGTSRFVITVEYVERAIPTAGSEGAS